MTCRLICVILCALLAPSSACFAGETQRVYLSGRDKDNTVPWKFMCTTGAKSREWTTIPVPSNWDVLGFGMLNYKKDIETALEEHGLYQHEFDAPADWSNKRVFIVFEGVMTDTVVKINGQSAGPMHQGGFYRFKYEITDFLKFGAKNLLEVNVAKHSANESVNKAERTADYWVFGGIYRPVYLEVVPQQFIERVAIDAQADGEFAADVYIAGKGEADTAEAQITELDGTAIGNPFSASIENGKLRLTTKLDALRQWSAEKPNLYRVEFRLKKGEDVLHQLNERFGFRTVEVRPGDGIYVNGQRVVFKGVNRHSTWPDSGRCLSEEVHRLDIKTIQDMNMNAVRMSHYPPDPEFLDLCDELGLYVLDELAGWHWHYDTPTGRRLVESLVTRDVNHPSVIFWDNGNEGGFNVALDEVFGEFDPQRRKVLHAWEAFNFINTAHYLEYDRTVVASRGAPTRHGPTEVYQEWEDLNDPNKYIYMPTEMLHGLYDGGSGAGLADYWQMMQDSPLLGGAFLWVLFDEGIKRPDGTIDLAANQAPDGIVGPYREREASFYTIKELWSPIQVKRAGNVLHIDNQYSFTDASECQLTWQLRRLRQPYETESGFKVVAEKKLPLPAIDPGETGLLKLVLPQSDAEVLAVRVNDPQGRELWTWTWSLIESVRGSGLPGEWPKEDLKLVEGDKTFDVSAGSLKISVSKSTGLIENVFRGDQRFSLSNGPVATTGKSKLISIKPDQSRPDVISIAADYDGPLKEVVWYINEDGWVECSCFYSTEGTHDLIGVTFDYPEKKVLGKKWLGDGPFRVWKNRRHGVSFNVWENKYNDTVTGFSGWEYPEFKGCFANVHWLRLDTTEGPITVLPGNTEGFVQVLTPKFPSRELEGETKVNLPQCGLAFLDAIPAVGSKFKTATTTGPHGQSNIVDRKHPDVYWFYFGEFPQR